jgi:MtfA peptidase
MGLFFLFIIGLVFFSGKITRFFKHIYIGKKEQEILHQFYTGRFSYYNLLDTKEKRKFLIRVINIHKRNELRIDLAVKNTKNEIEFLICAAFTQITFGYDDYEIETFNKIVVYPKTFYSKLVNHEVKGLTIGTGYIFYSWEDFLDGYKIGNDKVNLALHELAHALYIDRFHDVDNPEWEEWTDKATIVLESLKNDTRIVFFRSYGKRNINEFWAVSVECFFEDPVNFKKEHPYLYTATSSILKQDMALRTNPLLYQ